MAKKFEYLVIGGGLVGCLVSLILSKKKYNVCLFEKNKLKKIISNSYVPLSLSINSVNFLKDNKIWDKEIFQSNEINNLTIKLFNSFNVTELVAQDINEDHLGCVVNKLNFLSYLRDQCLKNRYIEVVDNCDINISDLSSPFEAYEADRKLDLSGTNLIITDGANSKFAKKLDIKTDNINYDQTSYMFNVNCNSLPNTAYQIFNKKGIFAVLPGTENRACVVASIYNQYKDFFNFESQLCNYEFLEETLRPFIKKINNPSLIYKYDLDTQRLDIWTKNNILFLGNSSQLLHPAGAQGFNFAVDCIKEIDSLTGDLFTPNELDSSVKTAINTKRSELLKSIDIISKTLMKNNLLANIASSVFSNVLNISSTMRVKFLKNILGIS